MNLYMIAYENQDDENSTDWFFTVSEAPLKWEAARKKAIQYLMKEWGIGFFDASKAITEVYVNLIEQIDGYEIVLKKIEEKK